jgi:hypothetical protein
MGYSTDFEGVLTFDCEMNVVMLRSIKNLLGGHSRDLGVPSNDSGYIDLELTNDFTGVKWDGGGKTYNLQHSVTAIIRKMREQFPQFGLSGELIAQGEDPDDKWRLTVVDGVGIKTDIPPTGTQVSCPSCRHKFRVQP